MSSPSAATAPAGGRTYGTVYGAGARPTSANWDAPLEASGSLTGHILAQGNPATLVRRQNRGNGRRRLLAVLITIVVLVGIGAGLAAIFYNEVFGR